MKVLTRRHRKAMFACNRKVGRSTIEMSRSRNWKNDSTGMVGGSHYDWSRPSSIAGQDARAHEISARVYDTALLGLPFDSGVIGHRRRRIPVCGTGDHT